MSTFVSCYNNDDKSRLKVKQRMKSPKTRWSSVTVDSWTSTMALYLMSRCAGQPDAADSRREATLVKDLAHHSGQMWTSQRADVSRTFIHSFGCRAATCEAASDAKRDSHITPDDDVRLFRCGVSFKSPFLTAYRLITLTRGGVFTDADADIRTRI